MAHCFVVFTEDRLEDSKVEMSHLEDYFIENFYISCFIRILFNVKEWWLETFHNHVVSIDDFLWQDHQ